MARDAELDRLKTAQDLAFQRKQEAYQAQQKTWDRLLSTKDELNRAHEEKQHAYTVQESAWQECQRTRSSNGPRIDQLNSMQTNAFENMKRAFDSASSAHERRDGASAKMYSEEGHRYKSEAQGYVVERRRLVEEIRSANNRLAATKPAFQIAKENFSSVKRVYDQLKSEHERAREEFKRAKSEFDQVAKSFKNRLELVRNEQKLHNEKDRRLAEQAGVPYQYLDSVKVKHGVGGIVNFYFGGIGEKDGLWHGHIVTNSSGRVTYERLPIEEHGSKNYTGANGIYNGIPAKIVFSDRGNSNRIDIYFGGVGEPDGPGHNHVTVIKENIRFWRENGQIIIDEKIGTQ